MLTYLQLVTAFTVVFLTTIATFVERFALWKARNDTKYSPFEQYKAKTSLTSAIKMVVPSRIFHWTSLALIATWTWYYFSSQAVSKEYSFQLSAPHHNSRVFFQSTEAPSVFADLSTLTDADVSAANSLYDIKFESHLIQASDMYGGAVIPLMSQMTDSGFVAPEKEDGWWSVPTSSWTAKKASTSVVFSSAAGLPVYWANGDQAGPMWIGSYSMNASYIFANCSDAVERPVADFPEGVIETVMTSFNISSELTNGFARFDVWNRVSNSSIHSSCLLETHYVEMQANCDAKACAVYKIRPTHGKAFPSPSTPFIDTDFADEFFDELLLSDGIPDTQVLVDGQAYFECGMLYTSGYWTALDGSKNIGPSLSKRITQMINTYMSAAQPQDSILELTPEFMLGLINGTIHNTTWPTGPAHGAMYSPGYHLAMPWVIFDLITCTILLLLAIASFWMRLRTQTPEVFRYRSSISMGKPDNHLPAGANAAAERIRGLRGFKLKGAGAGRNGNSEPVGAAVTDDASIPVPPKTWSAVAQ
jgi:hypothetical protein